jgi:hypothetical protein
MNLSLSFSYIRLWAAVGNEMFWSGTRRAAHLVGHRAA